MMQRTRLTSHLGAAMLAAALTGCATPQPALDQGNATAALAARFSAELAAYRRSAARVAQLRVANIRDQERLIAQQSEIHDWNRRTAGLAGLGDAEASRQVLLALVASRASDAAATEARLAELDKHLATLVKPSPSSTAKLAELQQALAALGTELSAAERLQLALEAVQTVRDEVKKNSDAKAAIEAREDPAPTLPKPPPQEPQP